MLRKLLVLATGVLFTWFAALPANASGEPQQFQIQGTDMQRGDYSGQLTLRERSDGTVKAERTVTFERDGSEQVQRGVLKQRGDALRGVLRENTGAVGKLEQREGESTLVSVTLNDDAGTCEGSCIGSRGVGSFDGISQTDSQTEAEPAVLTDPNAFPPPTPVAPDPDDDGDPDAAPDPDDDDAPVVIDDPLGDEPAVEPDPEPVRTQAPSGETFAGRAIYDYDPGIGITDVEGAYRVATEEDDGDAFLATLEKLLSDPKIKNVKAIVLGNWGSEDVDFPSAILRHKDALKDLRALFVGDIDQEEAEISWIMNADIGPVVEALPKLETLKVRGGTGLGFSGAFEHKSLESIEIESGGTPASAVRELAKLQLPALERLELWLGTDEYGGDSTIEDVRPFLRGTNLPKLKYLGLMNSDITDDIALDADNAPILAQLDTLDLSMGTLGDVGAAALVASDAIKRLKTLNVDHHYMTAAMMAKMDDLSPVNVIVGGSELDPDDDDYRYVAVGE